MARRQVYEMTPGLILREGLRITRHVIESYEVFYPLDRIYTDEELEDRVRREVHLGQEIEPEIGRRLCGRPANMPFYLRQLTEAGERLVRGVRTETESVVAGIATRLGFDSLRSLSSAASAQIETTHDAEREP